jgi:hypothetical protein
VNDVGVALLILVFIVVGVVSVIVKAWNAHLVNSNQADYFVKIAASGKGSTYHALSCNRSRGAVMLTLAAAQARGYAPCASCGGTASVRRTNQ